ncbi:MAG: hypothetical protein WA185_09030, partial [Candidatus Acidiferrales bacterium]
MAIVEANILDALLFLLDFIDTIWYISTFGCRAATPFAQEGHRRGDAAFCFYGRIFTEDYGQCKVHRFSFAKNRYFPG